MPVTSTLRAAEREIRVSSRLWRSNLFSVFLAPVLTLAALGIGLGGLVDAESGDLGGVSYLDFITPGLLVASVVQTAAGTSLWPVMAGHRWVGFHYAQVATPMSAVDVFGGHVVFVVWRAALQATVFLVAGAMLGGVGSGWGILAIPAALMTAVAFGTPLAAFAAVSDNDSFFDVIIRVIIQPLYLFSGTVFPIEQLPDGLRVVVQLFPLAHGVELARAATTGTGAGVAMVGHGAVLVAYVLAGTWWGRRAFARRLTP